MNLRGFFSRRPTIKPPGACGSILFITLDSCRYDTFAAADIPLLKSVGPLHRVQAPANFTFASHMAMFVGFTPGDPRSSQPLVNPKVGKFFRLSGGGAGAGADWLTLTGANVMEGLKKEGYTTIGAGSVRWFNDSTPTGRVLTQGFDHYRYMGDTSSLRQQVRWVTNKLADCGDRAFVFLNVGETHVPYYHEGALWDRQYNPCQPVRPGEKHGNDAAECRRRQRLCLEYVDRQLEPLLERFASANIIVCGDHGDCWGEDDCWEHGISHPKTLEVPLVFRVRQD